MYQRNAVNQNKGSETMEVVLKFKDETILVASSCENIGRAIVLEFASRGANVMINALDTDTDRAECAVLKAELEALGVQPMVVLGDASLRPSTTSSEGSHQRCRPGFGDVTRQSEFGDSEVQKAAAAAVPVHHFIDPGELAWAYALFCSARPRRITERRQSTSMVVRLPVHPEPLAPCQARAKSTAANPISRASVARRKKR